MGHVNTRDFARRANGVRDNTAALVKAEALARTKQWELRWNPGDYRTTGTITYGVAGQQSYHSWVGESGRFATNIRCEHNGVGVRVNGMFAGRMSDLHVTRPAGATGIDGDFQGIGIWMANESGGTGTGQTGNIFTQLICEGWSKGIQVGDVANLRAASELEFNSCHTQFCDVGFQFLDRNTLDIRMVGCTMGHGRLGADAGQAGNIRFTGGSSSFLKDATFAVGTGGTFTMQDFRTEEGGPLVFIYSTNVTAPTSVNLFNCLLSSTHPTYNPSKLAVNAFGSFALNIQGGAYLGEIGLADYYSTYGGTIIMHGAKVRGAQPFKFYWGEDPGQYGDRSLNKIFYDLKGNQRYSDTTGFIAGKYDDRIGVMVGQIGTPPYGQFMDSWHRNHATGVVAHKSAATFIRGETPAGVIDGVNTSFTFEYEPVSIQWASRDGTWMSSPADYAIAGTSLTTVVPPVSTLVFDYTK